MNSNSGEFGGMPYELNKIYTVEQVAKILQMRSPTIRQLCRTGQLEARMNISGYRVTGRAIDNYMRGILPLATGSDKNAAQKSVCQE